MFRILAACIEILFPPMPDDHPMTAKEFDRWNAAMILAGSCRQIHERLADQRRHDEMMAELRRIGR
jgi:hypothetical protein